MPSRRSTLACCLLALPLCFASGCAGPSLAERLRQLPRPLVVAHRGDSGIAPENTLPAFRSALAKGADLVELDFQQTKDGVLVCFHDATLDRTTDAEQVFGREKAKVAEFTFAELSRLDAGSWKASKYRGTRIPTLEAALRTIQPGAITMVEHKRGEAERLVALLRRMKLVDQVLVQSFDWDFVAACRKLEPRLTLALLGGNRGREKPVLADLAPYGVAMAHWKGKHLQTADVAALQRAGYLVCVYTLNDPAEIASARRRGVDAITTDYPERIDR